MEDRVVHLLDTFAIVLLLLAEINKEFYWLISENGRDVLLSYATKKLADTY